MPRRLLPSMNISTAMKMEETDVRMGSIRRDTLLKEVCKNGLSH
jgi:hypothetical protein